MAETTYDFKKLGAVDTVDEIQEGDTVLVERGGSIYRVAGGQVGGAGGYLLELGVGELTDMGEIAVQFCIERDVTDMISAYMKGSHVCIKYDVASIGEDFEVYPLTPYAALLSLTDVGVMGDGYSGIYWGEMSFSGNVVDVVFTNGNPLPTEASATSLNLLGGAKPVATEASDGEL